MNGGLLSSPNGKAGLSNQKAIRQNVDMNSSATSKNSAGFIGANDPLLSKLK